MSYTLKHRNDDVVRMRERGATYAEIGSAFGFTSARAMQICNKQKAKSERDSDQLYASLFDAARELGRNDPHSSALRVYNCLKRANIQSMRQCAECSDGALLGIRNFGKGSLEIVRAAQEARES